MDRLIILIVFLQSYSIGGMWHTNWLRHIFLEDELDMIATITIIDQATVETVQTVRSTEFYTDVAYEQLD